MRINYIQTTQISSYDLEIKNVQNYANFLIFLPSTIILILVIDFNVRIGLNVSGLLDCSGTGIVTCSKLTIPRLPWFKLFKQGQPDRDYIQVM